MIDLSIIIINKNYKQFLKTCVQSCLNQNTKFIFEIIYSDDGSSDGSIEYIKKLKSKKIKIILSKNAGIEKVANKAFKRARGQYVVRIDSDDYLKKNFVNIMIKKIKKSNYTFVYPNYSLINKNGKFIRNIFLPKFKVEEIFSRGDFLASGTLYNLEEIKFLQFYNEKIKNSGLENYELILKLLLLNKRGLHIKKNLFCYRRHKKNYSMTQRKKIIKNGKLLFNKLKFGKYKTNKNHPLAK